MNATAVALAPGPKRGVVLVNVGTPEAPTVPAVRAYLREFLSDPLVIDLPAPARWALLNLVILPFRPRRSAHAYQQVWTAQGSPLLVHSRAQAAALAACMPGVDVELAMRYGAPSLQHAREALTARGVTDLTLVPLYPQEAAATTGSAVAAWERLAPGSRVVRSFFSNPGFVASMAARVRETVEAHDAQHVLFSYHGLPVRQVARTCDGTCERSVACPPLGEANARCYRAQCYATTEAIAREAGVLEKSSTAFQSRLRGAAWVGPFTFETLQALAARGVKRVAVACPSFVADCLETLEEIAVRGAATFEAAGGEHLTLVPAVNDSPQFIEGLATLLRAHWENSP